MILNSLKSNTQVLLNPAGLPHPATVSTYSQLFSGGGLRGFVNSIIISAATTIGSVFLSAIAGYAFAKLYFRGRTVLFLVLLLTIMVPIQTAIPGFYLEFARLGWLNTYQIQIVPFLAPVFGLFIVRQYLLSVPDEFLEAARIDGAGEWYIFSRIILPIRARYSPLWACLRSWGRGTAICGRRSWPALTGSSRCRSCFPTSLTKPLASSRCTGPSWPGVAWPQCP